MRDRGQLERSDGRRRRHHAPPAAGVRRDGEAALGREAPGGRLVEQRPDRLRRVRQRRVVRPRSRSASAGSRTGVRGSALRERLLDEVADHALALRADARRAGTAAPTRPAPLSFSSSPTCGPLPCVTIDLVLARSAAPAPPPRRAALARWFGALIASPRRDSALPPSATTIAHQSRPRARRGARPARAAAPARSAGGSRPGANTTDCGPSITSAATSWPRWAGRQCMKIASGCARAISAGVTW